MTMKTNTQHGMPSRPYPHYILDMAEQQPQRYRIHPINNRATTAIHFLLLYYLNYTLLVLH